MEFIPVLAGRKSGSNEQMTIVKRIVFALMIVIVILCAGFISAGLIFPRLKIETRVEIKEPVDVSWAYFTDESKLGEWMKGFKKIERLSGPPQTPGSKFLMTFEENGQEIKLEETVNEFKQYEPFAFVIQNEVITDDVKVRFSEENGKTIVVQEDNITGGNFFWRSVFALSQSSFRSNVQGTYDRLKANIEKAN